MTRRILNLFLLIYCLAAGAAGAAGTRDRIALVIGNAAYGVGSTLTNPTNDATDIAAALDRLGFEVTLALDATNEDMRRLLRGFSRAAETADLSLVYFAGHGIEVDKVNYLIPVGATLNAAADAELETLPLDLVMQALAGAPGIKIVLVDACRDNPFAARLRDNGGTRSIGTGLSRVDPIGGVRAGGILVGYAAREGTVALDGEGRNSPYAQALLEQLEEPGLEVSKLFRKVRDRVFALTFGEQEPFTYGALPGEDIYLVAQDISTLVGDIRPSGPTALSWMEVAAPSLTANIDGMLSPAQRRQVQAALLYLGGDPGGFDGHFGTKTRQAIVAARLKLGLPPNDFISKQLLELLPNAPAIDLLKSTSARSYRSADLPDNREPRLTRALEVFAGRRLVFDYYQGRLYVAVQANRADWDTSSRLAVQAGGHLVTFSSAEENRFVSGLVSFDPGFFVNPTYGSGLRGPFIGLFRTDKSGTPASGWRWVSGEPLGFDAWATGQPDDYKGWESSAAMAKSSLDAAVRWEDVAGVAPGFIVEIE